MSELSPVAQEIRDRRTFYHSQIRELQTKIAHVRVDLDDLERMCPHENQRVDRSYDGSSETVCDDCGSLL